MAEPRLGPEELDRLEDALEDLEFRDDFSDPSEAVSQRLADFKAILQASREALPLEDVRPGLLEGVLAEARLSAEDTQAPAAQPAGESFWARFRKSWLIPSLAVAATAALVLLLIPPALTLDAPAEEPVGAVAVNEAPTPKTPSPAAAAPASADEPAQDEDYRATPPAAAASSRAGPQKQDAFAAEVSAAEKPADAAEADAEPEPEPEAEPAPGAEQEKTEAPSRGWNAIEEGDSSRKGGDCFTARNHYARALDDGNDSVRARAYVGMGLCKREEGNEAAAKEYFDQARELDEDALDFAGTQSKERRSKKPKPRRPRKKASGKRKNSIDFNEAPDPMSGL